MTKISALAFLTALAIVFVIAMATVMMSIKAEANPVLIGATEGSEIGTVVAGEGDEILKSIENLSSQKPTPDLVLPSSPPSDGQSRFDAITQEKLRTGSIFTQIPDKKVQTTTVVVEQEQEQGATNSVAVLENAVEKGVITTTTPSATGTTASEKIAIGDKIEIKVTRAALSTPLQQAPSSHLTLPQALKIKEQAVQNNIEAANAYYSSLTNTAQTLPNTAQSSQSPPSADKEKTYTENPDGSFSPAPSSGSSTLPPSLAQPTIDSNANIKDKPSDTTNDDGNGSNNNKKKLIVGGAVAGGAAYLIANNGTTITDDNPQNHPVDKAVVDTGAKVQNKVNEVGEKIDTATKQVTQAADNLGKAVDSMTNSLQKTSTAIDDAGNKTGDIIAMLAGGVATVTAWIMNAIAFVIEHIFYIAAVIIGLAFLIGIHLLKDWWHRFLDRERAKMQVREAEHREEYYKSRNKHWWNRHKDPFDV